MEAELESAPDQLSGVCWRSLVSGLDVASEYLFRVSVRNSFGFGASHRTIPPFMAHRSGVIYTYIYIYIDIDIICVYYTSYML